MIEMTEKRFTVKDDVGMLDVACANIFDNGEFVGAVPLFDAEKFVDLLNEQHERIHQLQDENYGLKKQVKKVLKKQLDKYTQRALLLKEPYGDVTEAIHDIAGELGVDLE